MLVHDLLTEVRNRDGYPFVREDKRVHQQQDLRDVLHVLHVVDVESNRYSYMVTKTRKMLTRT
jgi:hypothetical protein